jgi:coenzyme F420-reducing hydrogenase delta subunit
MINVSAAMGGQFAWSAAEITAEIKQMGPNPLKGENANEGESVPVVK